MTAAVFFVFLSLGAYAADPTPAVDVISLDKKAQSTDFREKEFNLRGPNPPGATRDKDVPNPKVRNQQFNEAGISGFVKTWDELDKDILWIRSKSLQETELQKRYPQIPKDKLIALQKKLKSNAP